jgi:hypothetical protein
MLPGAGALLNAAPQFLPRELAAGGLLQAIRNRMEANVLPDAEDVCPRRHQSAMDTPRRSRARLRRSTDKSIVDATWWRVS